MSEFRIERSTGPEGERVFKIGGPLTRCTVARLKKSIPAGAAGAPIVVDLTGVTEFDSFGAVFLFESHAAAKGRFTVAAAPRELKELVEKLARVPLADQEEAPPPGLVEKLGQKTIELWHGIRSFLALGFEFFYWLGLSPFKGGRLYTHRTISEIVATGVDAIPILFLISSLMGVILALNAAAQLERFGATIFVADLVAVALTKELGPVFTAILVAGRSGSAIAAELGTMAVTEEIDALKVMGINPRAFLVVPKILSLIVVMPCLALMADVLGIMGGLGVSLATLDLAWNDYVQQTLRAVRASHILSGLIKSVVFGYLVGLTGATLGMLLRGGAEEVGRVTTKSVVVSFLLIIVADALFTVIFASLGW